jgi:Protein of unknown function (DUF1573)
MQRCAKTLILLVFTVISIGSGWRVFQSSARSPSFSAEPEIVDLGIHSSGETLSGEVRFQNTYPHAVQIVEWSSSCSCTGLSVSTREVQPGGETLLNYEWHIGNRPGPTQQTLSILYHYGEAKLAIAHVYLRSVVTSESICEPRQLVFERGISGAASVRFPSGRLRSAHIDESGGSPTTFSAQVVGDDLKIDYKPVGGADDFRSVRVKVKLSGLNDASVTIPLIVQAPSGGLVPLPMEMPKGSP